MALTISNLVRGVSGNRRDYTATITFDSSYTTGGESLTPGDLGLDQIDFLEADPASGYQFSYDYTNKTLLAYRVTAAGTITGTTVASGTTGIPSFTITSGAIDASGAIGLSALSSAATLNNANFGGTISSPVGRPTFTGISSALNASFSGTAGALVEVTAGVNLSAVSTRVRAVGF